MQIYYENKAIIDLSPEEIEECKKVCYPISFVPFYNHPIFRIQMAKSAETGELIGYNSYATFAPNNNPFNDKKLPIFYFVHACVSPIHRDKDLFIQLYVNIVKHSFGDAAFKEEFFAISNIMNPKILRFLDTFYPTYPSPSKETPREVINYLGTRLNADKKMTNEQKLVVSPVEEVESEFISFEDWKANYQIQEKYLSLFVPEVFNFLDDGRVEIRPNRILSISHGIHAPEKLKYLLKNL